MISLPSSKKSNNGFASLSSGGLSDQFENLIQSFDLALCLISMREESVPQFVGLRALRHFRQSPQNMFFCKVNVLQSLVKEIMHVLRLSGHHDLLLTAPIERSAARTNGQRTEPFRMISIAKSDFRHQPTSRLRRSARILTYMNEDIMLKARVATNPEPNDV
jgi:hypothetical protein